jgi:hypothetical protein
MQQRFKSILPSVLDHFITKCDCMLVPVHGCAPIYAPGPEVKGSLEQVSKHKQGKVMLNLTLQEATLTEFERKPGAP